MVDYPESEENYASKLNHKQILMTQTTYRKDRNDGHDYFEVFGKSINKMSMPETHFCKVGIGLLGIQPIVVLNILEGLVHEATIAAMISLWPRTVHKVLLAQRHQFTRFTEQLAL